VVSRVRDRASMKTEGEIGCDEGTTGDRWSATSDQRRGQRDCRSRWDGVVNNWG